MKFNHLALAAAVAVVSVAGVAKADALYASADVAQATCGADPVVWIDLDRGRYYQLGTAAASKGGNGVYACEKTAHAKYREGKSEPTAVATKQ
jgi:hypothetical protein